MSKKPLVIMDFNDLASETGMRSMMPVALAAVMAPTPEGARVIQAQIKDAIPDFPVFYDLQSLPAGFSRSKDPARQAQMTRHLLNSQHVEGIDFVTLPNGCPGYVDRDYVRLLAEHFELVEVGSIAEAKSELAKIMMGKQGLSQKSGGVSLT